jgi:hypothetical protein
MTYQIDTLLLNREAQKHLIDAATASPDWRQVYQDQQAVIFEHVAAWLLKIILSSLHDAHLLIRFETRCDLNAKFVHRSSRTSPRPVVAENETSRIFLAYCLGVSIAFVLLFVAQMSTGWVGKSDFVALYTGGELLRLGNGHSLYDLVLQAEIQSVCCRPTIGHSQEEF